MQQVELTPQEAEWNTALGDFNISPADDDRFQKLEAAERLAHSLLDRKAIPVARARYFTEPTYNLSNPRKSHQDYFETNGTKGDEILRHPSFLKYLRYFVHGADLPVPLKTQLADLYEAHHYDDDFIESAGPVLRNHYKTTFSAERTSFAEEVFKLCLNLGVELNYAGQLRNKVLTWRK